MEASRQQALRGSHLHTISHPGLMQVIKTNAARARGIILANRIEHGEYLVHRM